MNFRNSRRNFPGIPAGIKKIPGIPARNSAHNTSREYQKGIPSGLGHSKPIQRHRSPRLLNCSMICMRIHVRKSVCTCKHNCNMYCVPVLHTCVRIRSLYARVNILFLRHVLRILVRNTGIAYQSSRVNIIATCIAYI